MLKFTSQENQDKFWLPLNSISERIWYTNDNSKNMRVLVSAVTEHPLAWTISKVENSKPFGIQKLTLYQDDFDQNRDYVNLETKEMYADYYDFSTIPDNNDNHIINKFIISASSSSIRVGGSYKKLSFKIYDSDNKDITISYLESNIEWKCFVDDIELTNDVEWKTSNNFNEIKIKFPKKLEYLGKLLTVRCVIDNMVAETDFKLEM